MPRPHSSLAVPNLGQACLSSKHIVLDPRQPSGFRLQVRLALHPLQEQPYFVAPYPVHGENTGAAEADGAVGARLGCTQATEEISLGFSSLQKRVLGQGQQLPWLLG